MLQLYLIDSLSVFFLAKRWFFLSFVQTNVPPGMCYVDHIVVEEEFRGKGVGKVLLETAENAAREKKCDVSKANLWICLVFFL